MRRGRRAEGDLGAQGVGDDEFVERLARQPRLRDGAHLRPPAFAAQTRHARLDAGAERAVELAACLREPVLEQPRHVEAFEQLRLAEPLETLGDRRAGRTRRRAPP